MVPEKSSRSFEQKPFRCTSFYTPEPLTADDKRPENRRKTMTPSLCNTCEHVREIVSGKGSRFLLCGLAQLDPRFPKYPRQPVVRCEGHVLKAATETSDRKLNDA